MFNQDISIIKTIMIMYLFIFANVISTKINTKIIERIEENIIIKHIIGLITVGVILSLVYKNLCPKRIITYSIIIYFIFILSTKVPKKYILLSVILLMGFYFMNYFTENKLYNIKKDKSINLKNKENSINHLEKKCNTMTFVYIFAILAGSLLYDEKKYNQYGGSYSLSKFLNF